MKTDRPTSTAPAPWRRQAAAVFSTIGLLAIMTAAALPLLRMADGWFGYLYAAGAAMLLAGRLFEPVPAGAGIRLRRLLRLEVWTALIFAAGAVFILAPFAKGNDWIAFTLAGGVLTLYTSIMIPRQKKEPEK